MAEEVLIREVIEDRSINKQIKLLLDFATNWNEVTYQFITTEYTSSISFLSVPSYWGYTTVPMPIVGILSTSSPREVYCEVDVEEWKKAIFYGDEEIDNYIEKLLRSYNIEPSDREKEWLKNQIRELIDRYEKEFEISLPKEVRESIFKIIVKIAYDKLVI